jgi:protein involved in polysaccharide export with SLBB domain
MLRRTRSPRCRIVPGTVQTRRPSTPPVSAKVEAPEIPLEASDSAGTPFDPKNYVIGPEDIINVEVWREADFTRAHLVRPDGRITIRMIGDVQSAGLIPERLAAQLAVALNACWGQRGVAPLPLNAASTRRKVC